MQEIEAGQIWKYKKIKRPNIYVRSVNKYNDMVTVSHVNDERNNFELSRAVLLDSFELVTPLS
jgi:hypothetical protein